MKSQWECMLQNLGEWEGSFTQIAIDGTVIEEVPSRLILEQLEAQRVRLTLTRESPKYANPLVQEYSTLSRSLLFFETGAFSQGSIQLAPFSQFGAEFGLVKSDRRLRLVLLYPPDNSIQSLTLIRERRSGSTAPEQPTLQVSDLVGTWQGNVTTLTPDWQVTESTSTLQIEQIAIDRLQQSLTFGDRTLTSTAQIQGSVLKFDQGSQPVQVLLLPDGASASFPIEIQRGKPLFLECGWMLEPGLRQRLIRSYDALGGWVSLTLVTERKIA